LKTKSQFYRGVRSLRKERAAPMPIGNNIKAPAMTVDASGTDPFAGTVIGVPVEPGLSPQGPVVSSFKEPEPTVGPNNDVKPTNCSLEV